MLARDGFVFPQWLAEYSSLSSR